MLDLSVYFATVGAMIPMIVAVTAFVNRYLKLKGFPAQLLAWVVGVAAALVGFFTGWSAFLVGLPIWGVIGLGFVFGLGANGLFKIPLIKAIVDAITKIEKRG